MKKLQKNNLKVSILAVFLIAFLALPALPAQAILGGSFDIPSPTDAMNEVMGDLGIDKSEARYSASSFNQSRQKKQAPQVSLNFSTPNPVRGEQISVEATPMYFGNSDMKDLYYTWFIQHNNGTANGGNTDLDGNGTIDREDWKIEAARIIAGADFNWENASYATDWDNDGYTAVYGGEDQRNKTDDPKCFIHDFNSGNEYEIDCGHMFPDASNSLQTGDGSFEEDEEEFWRTDPRNNDTAGFSQKDEATVAGLGQNSFTWNYEPGDRVGVVVEGISFEPTQENDSSYKVMWALPRNECHPEDFLEKWDDVYSGGSGTTTGTPDVTEVRACLSADVTDSDLTFPVDNCSGGPLNLEQWNNNYGYSYGGRSNVGAGVPTTAISIGDANPTPPTTPDREVIQGITVAADGLSITFSERPSSSYAHLDNDEILGNVITKITSTVTEVTEEDAANQIRVEETQRYNLDIEDQSGQSQFSGQWDGTTTTTTHSRDFDMTPDDLNECLEHNLFSPAEGNPDEKIKVTLTATPDSPMNDPSGINSDYLQVDASIRNVSDADYLQYDWEVYQTSGDNPNPPNGWGNMLTKAELVESTQTSGLGVKSLRFKLALDSSPPPQFLKVKLVVTEDSANAIPRKGSGSMIIPLSSSDNKIFVWNTQIDPNNPEYFARNIEVCVNNSADPREKERNAICPVLKNEVIGLEYRGTDDTSDGRANTQYLWTLNGAPIKYDTCFFAECETAPGREEALTNVAFFPVLGDVGTTYTVGLTVVTPAGQKRNLIRTFRVENPSIRLSSTNQYAQAVLLGHYIGLDGTQYADYSETNYQAVAGTTIDLFAKRLPFDFPITNDKTQWFVDGQETGITGTNIAFAVNKPVGDFYTVSFNTLYTQSLEKKRLMYQYWGVMPDQFYEIQLSATLDVTMVDSLPGVVVTDDSKPSNKILAALFSNFPLYVSFLFRLILTTLLLLFGSWVILSFSPNTANRYDD